MDCVEGVFFRTCFLIFGKWIVCEVSGLSEIVMDSVSTDSDRGLTHLLPVVWYLSLPS
jgi:hypothetical protein